MTDPPPGVDRRIVDKASYIRAALGDIDPAKHAGEGFFQTDEYFPQDIQDPHLRGDVLHEGAYYPGPSPKRRKR